MSSEEKKEQKKCLDYGKVRKKKEREWKVRKGEGGFLVDDGYSVATDHPIS